MVAKEGREGERERERETDVPRPTGRGRGAAELIMQLPFCLTSTLFEVLSRNEPSRRATRGGGPELRRKARANTQPRFKTKWFGRAGEPPSLPLQASLS